MLLVSHTNNGYLVTIRYGIYELKQILFLYTFVW